MTAPLYTWRAALVHSNLPPLTRLVALTLSTHMTPNGDECWPSVPLLARECALNAGTVRRHLRRLEADEWLLVQPSKGGRNRTNRWQAHVPFDHSPPPQTRAPARGIETRVQRAGKTEAEVGARAPRARANPRPRRATSSSGNSPPVQDSLQPLGIARERFDDHASLAEEHRAARHRRRYTDPARARAIIEQHTPPPAPTSPDPAPPPPDDRPPRGPPPTPPPRPIDERCRT